MLHPTDDLAAAGAGVLAHALAERRLSALEACDAAIARIEQGDATLNAVVVRDFDRARDAARAADAALARGDRRPLLGVPMTVKESYNVAGLPTTWGFAQHAGQRPSEDAVLVARLKAAGAVVLGKTNVPTALADWQSDNPVYGRTSHPLDATRTPGGSSGGAAAAVAAGLVPLEIGSDIGGSIRVPAHFCGVYGLKPTHGLLPSRGHAFPGTDGAGIELAVCGPLARSAADLDLALGVLAGPADDDDAAAWRLALPAPRGTGWQGLRVVVLDRHPCAAVDTSIRAALDRLAAGAARCGARVERASALLPDLAAGHGAYTAMLQALMTRGMPGERPVISAHEWFALLDRQAHFRRAWQAFFESCDVLLMPPFGTTAFPHVEEPDWSRRRLMIDGIATPYGDQLAWAGPATFAGLPAAAAPLAHDRDGLPIGVQIVAGRWRDRQAIAVAALVADAMQQAG